MNNKNLKSWEFNGQTYCLGHKTGRKWNEQYQINEHTEYNLILKENKGLKKYIKGKYKIVEQEEIPMELWMKIGSIDEINYDGWTNNIVKIAKEKYGMPVQTKHSKTMSK